MLWLCLRRLGQAIITLLITVTAVFAVARLSGNPADVMLPQTGTPAERVALIHQYGLDKPILTQYLTYMSGLVHGNFGDSLRYRVPVMQVIWPRTVNSVKLGLVAVLLSCLVGIPLGVISAIRRGRWLDRLTGYIAVLGQSIPPFVMAIVLILLFAVVAHWLPPSGMDSWKSFILPSVTIASFIVAGVVRLVRSSMLEILHADFITLARSKGASGMRVIWRHAVPNAVIPVVTFVGLMFGVILTAGVTVEVIFAWPGLAQLVYDSILSRDYPLTQAAVTVGAALVILVNLVVDILHIMLDPRTHR